MNLCLFAFHQKCFGTFVYSSLQSHQNDDDDDDATTATKFQISDISLHTWASRKVAATTFLCYCANEVHNNNLCIYTTNTHIDHCSLCRWWPNGWIKVIPNVMVLTMMKPLHLWWPPLEAALVAKYDVNCANVIECNVDVKFIE